MIRRYWPSWKVFITLLPTFIVSLINSNGELMTLEINEEVSEGVRLVELRRNEAVFEKGEDSFLIINFKNQIKETSGEY